MKKLIVVILLLSMTAGIFMVAYADNSSGAVDRTEESAPEFSIETATDENRVVTRTYMPPHEGVFITAEWSTRNGKAKKAAKCSYTPIILSRDATTCEDVKELLSDMGISDAVIADMNQARLMEIARAESVTTQIAYLKRDAEGNVTYVTEEALANAETSESVSSEMSIPAHGEEIGFEDQISDDEYLKTSIILLNCGSAKYKVTLDCEWLKMPKYRSTDSIGISIENQTIELSSCTGWVSYTRTNSVKGTSVTETEGIPSGQFRFAEWDCRKSVAMLFDFKNDWILGDHFYNYRAHMEVEITSEDYIRVSTGMNGKSTDHCGGILCSLQ